MLHKTSKNHRVLKKCPDCGILFITHPGNRKRNDIDCPFGCRETRDRKHCNLRVSEYYGSDEGSMKKKKLNQKRYLLDLPKESAKPEEIPRKSHLDLKYMAWLLGMIEGRKVAKDEVLTLMKKLETTPPSKMEETG